MARLLCDAAELESFWCSTMQSYGKLRRLQKPSLVEEAGVQDGENPVKFPWNPGQNYGNLGKMCENLRKITICALILQKWHPQLRCRRFWFFEGYVFLGNLGKFGGTLGKNGAWCALIWKTAPTFFWEHFPWSFFRASLQPRKFACSYTHENLVYSIALCKNIFVRI